MYFSIMEGLARFLCVVFAVGVVYQGVEGDPLPIDAGDRTTVASMSATLSDSLRTTMAPLVSGASGLCLSKSRFHKCMNMGTLKPLVKIGCTGDLQKFLCSKYAPVCRNGKPLPPCRELCIRAHSGCKGVMTLFGLSWPEHLQCEDFPLSGGSDVCLLDQTFEGEENNEKIEGLKETEDTDQMSTLGQTDTGSPTLTKALPTPALPSDEVERDDEDNDTLLKVLTERTSKVVEDVAKDVTERWSLQKRSVKCSTVSYATCRKMGIIQQLLQIGCSDNLQYFLCSMYAPVCKDGVPLPPCRELCLKAHEGCNDVMHWFGLTWPSHLKCDQYPKYGKGVNCVLRSHYRVKEYEEARRVDGHWGTWSMWDECRGRCGKFGMQIRRRECNNPKPMNGGAKCVGEPMAAQVCNLPNPCPINGNWGEWAEFGDCSATCGEGKHTRTRACDNPAPQYGGITCYGRPTETETCNLKPCPVDGNWGPWEPYGNCSKTCGAGVTTRGRSCNNPEPAHGGMPCTGSASQQKACNVNPCPVKPKPTSYVPGKLEEPELRTAAPPLEPSTRESQGGQCASMPFKVCKNMEELKPLLNLGCTDSLQYFLCSVYAPVCENGLPMPPCRELCQKAHRGCARKMYWYGFTWPSSLNCNLFPSKKSGVKCVMRDSYVSRDKAAHAQSISMIQKTQAAKQG